jgi:aspartyl-tRNA(Asn)/glutamyl-tRNA(Gln) amidotransferase subunit A
MADLTRLTLEAARDGLRRKEFSARELPEAHVSAVEGARPLNAFITETPEQALRMAAASDERLARGEGRPSGRPAGRDQGPVLHEGRAHHGGLRILDGFVPPYESAVTRKLWEAGAVCLGKSNLDEFAMGSSNMTSHHGGVRNPWTRPGDNKDLVPGGSSGGSAAAVAARIALGATGTDTGGSIRQPAAFCGIVGMKPTYGRCSRWGVVAFASSLDQAGSFGRTVGDAALLLQAMAGHDPMDSTSADLEVPTGPARSPATCGAEDRDTQGVPRRRHAGRDRPGVAAGRRLAEGAGRRDRRGLAAPHEVRAPDLLHHRPAEASSNLARYDGMRYGLRVEGGNLQETYKRTRGEGFGAEVRRRVMIGTYVLSAGYYDAYYVKAQKVRRRIADDFAAAFERCDAILTPTTPSAAFRAGDKMDDPVAMYLNDVFTVPTSLAGLPGISVPAGLSAEGLPLGLQVVGRPWDEATVFRVGRALEEAAGFDVLPYGLEAA